MHSNPKAEEAVEKMRFLKIICFIVFGILLVSVGALADVYDDEGKITTGESYTKPMVAQTSKIAHYPSGWIIGVNGENIKGKNLTIYSDSASIAIDGITRSYQLSEVNTIMAKRGLARKVSAGCGCGCAAFWILSIIAISGSNSDETDYLVSGAIVGGALYTIVSFAGGYLIGNRIDDWKVVYSASQRTYHSEHTSSLSLLRRSDNDWIVFRYRLRF